MPSTAGVIRVNPPAGLTLSVTITTGSDGSVTSYTAQNGSTPHDSPAAIASSTDFHLTSTGLFHVVCEYNDATIDDQIVTVSSYGAGPTVVAPVLDVDELADATPTGASVQLGNVLDAQLAQRNHKKVNQVTVLASGGTVTLATLTGAGTIHEIWLAADCATTAGSLRDTRLQVFYDGSGTATIDMDLGTLFATHFANADWGHPAFCQHVQAEYQEAAGGTRDRFTGTLRFPIPYSNGCVVKLYNPAGDDLTQYASVLYTPNETHSYRLKSHGLTFAAHATVAAAATYDFMDVSTTTGLWLVYMSMAGLGATNQSWLERNVQMFLDGAGSPDMDSSGTEDFFRSAYYFMGNSYVSAPTTIVGRADAAVSVVGLDLLESCGGIRATSRLLVRWPTDLVAVTSAVDVSYCLLYYEAT